MVKLTSYTSSKVKGDLADLADLGSATDLARLAEEHETDSRVLIPKEAVSADSTENTSFRGRSENHCSLFTDDQCR